jgi:hypothetical protein
MNRCRRPTPTLRFCADEAKKKHGTAKNPKERARKKTIHPAFLRFAA